MNAVLQAVGATIAKAADKAVGSIIPSDNDAILYNAMKEPTDVMNVDSLIGEPIESMPGFFGTIEGDNTKSGYVQVGGNKSYITRHCPTDSQDWYRKVNITLDGKPMEAWELESSEGKETK